MKQGQIGAVMAARTEVESAVGTGTAYEISAVSMPELRIKGWALGLAVKAGNDPLAEALGKAMQEIDRDGTLAKIFTDNGSPCRNPESPLTPGDKPCCTESPVRPPSRHGVACRSAHWRHRSPMYPTKNRALSASSTLRRMSCSNARSQRAPARYRRRARWLPPVPHGFTDPFAGSGRSGQWKTCGQLAARRITRRLYISTDGKLLAAAVEEDNSVALLQASDGKTLAHIKVEGENPEHAVFSPDSKWLYVSAEDAEQVDVIDVAARKQVGRIPVGKRPRGIGFTPTAAAPMSPVRSPARCMRLMSQATRCWPPFRPASFQWHRDHTGWQAGIRVERQGRHGDGDRPRNEYRNWHHSRRQAPLEHGDHPDGSKLYVANGRSDSVSVIDTENWSRLKDITVGSFPWGVVIK